MTLGLKAYCVFTLSLSLSAPSIFHIRDNGAKLYPQVYIQKAKSISCHLDTRSSGSRAQGKRCTAPCVCDGFLYILRANKNILTI